MHDRSPSKAGPSPSPGTALILGASRGLGLALCEEYLARGWTVVGTVREGRPGPAAELVAKSAGHFTLETLDITADKAIAALAGRQEGSRFDHLFVNAGISNGAKETVADATTEEFLRVMQTNALGPLRAIEALHHLVPASGLIAVMSSGLGSVANNTNGGWEVYRASKAALNTLMRSFSARQSADPRAMVLIAPGWVRTDMGGPTASLGIEDSIPLVVDTVLANQGKPGLRYLDRFGEPLPW